MRNKHLLFVIGLILGLSIPFVLGAASDRLEVWGAFEKVGIYQPVLSGVSSEGECFLAVTNTTTGQTEIYGISRMVKDKLTAQPFLPGRQGTVIIEPQVK